MRQHLPVTVALLAAAAPGVASALAPRSHAASVVVSDLQVPLYALQFEGPLGAGWSWGARVGAGAYSVGKGLTEAQTLLREAGVRLAWYPGGDVRNGWRITLDGRWADNRTRGERQRFDGTRLRLGALLGWKWTGRFGLMVEGSFGAGVLHAQGQGESPQARTVLDEWQFDPRGEVAVGLAF
jgi:hypothetical protein